MTLKPEAVPKFKEGCAFQVFIIKYTAGIIFDFNFPC